MQKNISTKDTDQDIPSDGNLNVGDIVYTKSSVVLDIGLVKNVDPLEIYARATKYDVYNLGTPSLYGDAEHCNWYNSGINVSLEEWKKISKDVGTDDICERIGLAYLRK